MTVKVRVGPHHFALVDDDDARCVNEYLWTLHKKTFPSGRVHLKARTNGIIPEFGKPIYMHRLILSADDGVPVDHIDGDGLNNTRRNIRLATPSQNQWNRHTTWAKSAPGVLEKNGKFYIRVKAYGRVYTPGRGFDNVEDATKARDELAAKVHGEFHRPTASMMRLENPR